MADKIDELELDISVTENQAAKKITQISKAISQLTETLTGLKSVSGELDKLAKIKLPSSLKNVKNLKINYKLQTATMPQVPTGQGNFNGIQTGASAKTQLEAAQKLRKVTEETAIAEKRVTSQVYKTSNVRKRTSKDIFEMFKQEKQTGEQQKKNNKNTKESATLWSKLTRSIVRIGFYRVIRSTLSGIAKGFTEGIDNLRSADDELDNSLKRISASTTTLQNSFASLLSPLIKSVEPVFTRISDSIANVVNRIEEAKAAMAGESKYTKILTSDTKEYQEALEKANGSLLEFDTFTTLGGKDSGNKGTIEAPVQMSKEDASGIIESLETIKELVLGISAAIATIGIMSLISKIGKVSSALKAANIPLGTTLASVTAIVAGFTWLISGIKDTISAFKEGGSAWEKAAGILKILAGALAVTFGIISMTKAAQSAKTIVGLVAGVATVGALITTAIASSKKAGSDIQSFATGGNFQTADMFYANEDGRTELIASNNSGGGAVMNLDQWAAVSETSFYNALARYGVAQNQRGNGVDMNSFGRAMANNSGFIAEMNRKNANLNLR